MMKTNENEFYNPDNQDVEHDTEAAASEDCSGGGEAARDNMADGGDKMAENEGPDEATDGPETTDSGEEPAQEPAPLTPEEQAAIWKDKFVRLSAEYDNYRKRTVREKLDLIAAGGEEVVRALLDVLDDMDRALAAIAATDDPAAIKQGIALIDSKLRGVLKARGLEEIEAVGSELDTDLHEAVARIPAPEARQKGKIIDTVQKGYKLKDKIIRYAKVVVGQ